MRAVVVREVGGPQVLQYTEVADPEPAAGQVVVDVEAAGVNYIDVYHRTGAYPLPLPFVAGSEGAGRVTAVGPGVDGVSVGDRVAWAMLPGTGYAERVAVPAERCVPVPDGVDTQTAAALMLQGLTAQYLTRSTFPIARGDVAVVHAAAGGVGLLLVQAVVALGGRVIGTTSTPAKADLAREAGAEDVVLYSDDLRARVLDATDGAGASVVYDGVGASTFDVSLGVLRRRGTMVLFGASSGSPPPFDPAQLGKKGSLFLTRPTLADHIVTRAELLDRARALFGWVASGAVRPRIGHRYPLAQAAQAHTDLEARRTTGKLLLLPE
ncbi:MAG: quinone oxidoreductase family protein [Actinomycetota bacterium]